MANFKITAATTVAELKEQFHNEFGGVLRVYQGRSEAPEDATLVSLGGKVGELECRASRTVGKFIEAFQSELGLKVKVYTKDNWVSVLDGITLATVREIPKNARKAQMEVFLGYKRSEEDKSAECEGAGAAVPAGDYPTYSEAVALHKAGSKSDRYKLSDDGTIIYEISDALEGPLIVPEGVEKVVFDRNDRIEEMTAIIMPDTVKEMKGYLNCNYCENLKYLRLSHSMKEIPQEAFYSLNMEELVIPEGVEVIGSGAFRYASIKRVSLPSTLKFILPGAFNRCDLEEIVIPAGVKAIFPEAFSGNSELSRVTLLSDETVVMSGAFEDCAIENEEELYASHPLGDRTFGMGEETYGDVEQRNWRDEVTGIRRELTYIPEYYCGPLRIAEGTEAYPDIEDYSGITELYLPDSITDQYFKIPENVVKLHVPEHCTVLRLRNLKRLEEFNCPASVEEISISESPIRYLVIPEGVTEVTICDMPQLEEVKLPETLTNLDLQRCPELKSVQLPASLTKLQYGCLKACSMLKSIVIPETITEIPDGFANGCWREQMQFTELVIPPTVTEIGEGALSQNSEIETVTIPASVKMIKANAFADCPKLTTVNVEGDPLVFPGAFDNTPGYTGKFITLPTTEFTSEGHPMVKLTVEQIFFKKNYYERASEFLDNDGYYGSCVVMESKSADQYEYPLDKVGYLTYSSSASNGLSDFHDEDEDACDSMLGRGYFMVAHGEDSDVDFGDDIYERVASALALILNSESGFTAENNPYDGPEAYFELNVKNFDEDEILHTYNYHVYQDENGEWKVDTL